MRYAGLAECRKIHAGLGIVCGDQFYLAWHDDVSFHDRSNSDFQVVSFRSTENL